MKRKIIKKSINYKYINNIRAISILLIYKNNYNYFVYINENKTYNKNIININNTLYIY